MALRSSTILALAISVPATQTAAQERPSSVVALEPGVPFVRATLSSHLDSAEAGRSFDAHTLASSTTQSGLRPAAMFRDEPQDDFAGIGQSWELGVVLAVAVAVTLAVVIIENADKPHEVCDPTYYECGDGWFGRRPPGRVTVGLPLVRWD